MVKSPRNKDFHKLKLPPEPLRSLLLYHWLWISYVPQPRHILKSISSFN